MGNFLYMAEFAQSQQASRENVRLRVLMEKCKIDSSMLSAVSVEDMEKMIALLEQDTAQKTQIMEQRTAEIHLLEFHLERLKDLETRIYANPLFQEQVRKTWAIDRLDLTLRTLHRLHRAGIHTVEALCAISAEDLAVKCKCGTHMVNEVRAALSKAGLATAADPCRTVPHLP